MATRAQGWLASSDARAYGLVNGTRVGGSRQPRLTNPDVTSACVTYTKADKSDARIFKAAPRDRKAAKPKIQSSQAKRDLILQATMGSIHEGAA